MWLIVIAVLVLILVIAYLYTKMTKLRVKDELETYRCKDYLLTKTEKTAFDKIMKIIEENRLPLSVFPKMRLVDFIWTPKENRNAYLKIQSKFVDFLIAQSPQLHPLIAIFIVNKENKSKMQSLEVIEPILKAAGVKLIKIEAKNVFADSFAKLLEEELKWAYQKNS